MGPQGKETFAWGEPRASRYTYGQGAGRHYWKNLMSLLCPEKATGPAGVTLAASWPKCISRFVGTIPKQTHSSYVEDPWQDLLDLLGSI